MDAIELASLFVGYAEAMKKAEELEKKIKEAVLELKETQKIAGVTATYYKETKETPDYEAAFNSFKDSGRLPKDYDLSKFQTTTPPTSWKSVCEDLFIVPAPGAPKAARVAVKVG